MNSSRRIALYTGTCLLCFAGPSAADVTFADDFDHAAGPSALWGNERGAWVIQSGAYGASQPTNAPPTISSLPFHLADLEFECDVVATDDGGIWLHVDDAGLTGILLVLARGNMYWHTIVNGNVTATLNQVNGVYSVGQNLHVRATAVGNLYTAYVDGNLITALDNAAFPSGRVGLYDFRNPNHNYDNVALTGQCASGEDCCPRISRNPENAVSCSVGPVAFHYDAAGDNPFTHLWRFEGSAGIVDVADGLNVDAATGLRFTASDVDTDTLTISNVSLGSHPNVLTFVGAVSGQGCEFASTAPATLTVCDHVGDVDCNGRVDLSDLSTQLANFGRADNPGRGAGDLDGDGDVDLSDLAALLGDFGSDCP